MQNLVNLQIYLHACKFLKSYFIDKTSNILIKLTIPNIL